MLGPKVWVSGQSPLCSQVLHQELAGIMLLIRCLVPTCETLQHSCSHPCTSFCAQEPSASGFSLNHLLAPGWLGLGRRSRLWLGLWAAIRGAKSSVNLNSRA